MRYPSRHDRLITPGFGDPSRKPIGPVRRSYPINHLWLPPNLVDYGGANRGLGVRSGRTADYSVLSGTDDYLFFDSLPDITALPVTLVAVVRIDETPAAIKVIFQTDSLSATALWYAGAQILINTSREPYIQLGDGGGKASGNRRSWTTSKVLEIGVWYTLVAVFRSLTDASFWISGEQPSLTPSGTASSVDFSGDCVAGLWDAELDRYLACGIRLLGATPHAWSDAFARQISVDPYRLLAPALPTTPPWIAAAAPAGGTTLQGSLSLLGVGI